MEPAKRGASVPPTAASIPSTPQPEKASSTFSITTKLIKFLLQRGMATDGLFLTELPEMQVTEFKTLHKRLKEDSLEHSQELLEHTKHVQVVAQLLLEFLKELSEPLLTYPNYDSFMMSVYIKEKAHRTKYCSTLLNSAPPHHVALTTQLLTLLHRLVANRSINGLSSELLAALFAPHFLRPKKICPYMKEDEATILSVMTALIDDYELLFSGDGGPSSESSGSIKIRKMSDSPYVTDLSQSQIGSGKLAPKPIITISNLSASKGHKRAASSANASFMAAMQASPRETKADRDDEITADDLSDDDNRDLVPGDLSESNDSVRSSAII